MTPQPSLHEQPLAPQPTHGLREGWWPRAWCALASSVAAPERAAAEPYLLTPDGWWLRAQVSRDAPPPLPGGYKAGEKVLYTGDSETASNGEKWVHGQQGEVMGPCDGEDGEEGLLMLFPGNTGSVECPLTEVRRLRAASALPNPRLRPTHATLCPRPVRSRDSLCRDAPALTA